MVKIGAVLLAAGSSTRFGAKNKLLAEIAVEAMMNANVFVTGITNALDLLLDQKRVIGTLRTEGDKHA
jgi:CTP:molybdopterin cytidylyltransferase MocA